MGAFLIIKSRERSHLRLTFPKTLAFCRFIIALFTVFFLSPVYAAEHPTLSAVERAWLREHPAPIRVHNEMDWPPFNFNKEGQAKGHAIDYMNLVAQKLGLNIEYVSGPTWNKFLEMMQEGTLDVMLNIVSTQQRRTYLKFTEPYLVLSTSLFVRNSENNISDLNDLTGKKLGFTKGFFFGEFIRKYYPNIKIVTFNSTLDSFVALATGAIDAALELPPVGYQIIQEGELTTLKFGGVISDPRLIPTFAIATRKDHTILRNIIQKGMDAITSTEAEALRQKWNFEKTDMSSISADDKAYLKKLGALRVCVNPDHLPMEALNLDGTLTGVSSEFIKLLEARIKTPLKMIPTDNWSETLNLSQQGKCDLLPMVPKTEKRQHYLNFTAPWLSVPIVVATRYDQIYISSLDQIIDEKIGVVRSIAIEDIVRNAYPKLNLTEVESVKDGLKKVKDGTLFGFIGTLPTVSRILQTDAVTKVKISGDVGLSIDYAIGVKAEDQHLLKILNQSLRFIDKNKITNIYNRWLAVAYIDRFDYTRFWQIFAGIIAFTFYVLYRHRRGVHIATELREAHAKVEIINQKLNEQAHTDMLTGLANRLRVEEELHRERIRFERTQEPFSIILLDIDHFKQVNDRHGHPVGDAVLKFIADVLKQNTRANDVPGRWGGEEFLIICPSTKNEGTVNLAETLRVSITKETVKEFPAQTASFGIATIQNGESIHDLVKRADEALYRAKKNGRNRVEQSTGPTA